MPAALVVCARIGARRPEPPCTPRPSCAPGSALAGRSLSMLAVMPEAVIVATSRSPIGRAFKGSLVEMRPDDLTVQIVKSALAKVPELDPSDVEDLMLGNGQPAGEAGLQPRSGRRGPGGARPGPGRDGEPLLLVVAADDPDGCARDPGRRGRRVRGGRRGNGEPFRKRDVRRRSSNAQRRCSPMPRRGQPSGPREAMSPGRLLSVFQTSTSRWDRPRRT